MILMTLNKNFAAPVQMKYKYMFVSSFVGNEFI